MSIKSSNQKSNQAFPMLHKSMNKGYDYANQVNPELADLLKQIFVLLLRPLVALRAKLYRIFLKPFKKIERKNLPIFRVGMLLFLVYIVNQKNVSFNFNLGDSAAMISQSSKTNLYDVKAENTTDITKSVIPKENEYAPVNVAYLEELSPQKYIERYKDLAIAEMKKYGIPASITLAQGLVESRAGNSRLATQNNNHFGVKCFSKKCAKGHCTNHFDDNHKDFFRKYNSAWESFRSHSQLLQKDRYKSLKSYGKDYKKWSVGLKKAGYATDKRYDKKLIATIKKYKLYEYDK